jgi:Amidase
LNRSIGFTSLFNASGHPAASLSLHWSAQGLPVGVQIIAQFDDLPSGRPDRDNPAVEGSSPTLDGLIPWSLARRGRWEGAEHRSRRGAAS